MKSDYVRLDDILIENHIGALVLKTGDTINYGVIRIEDEILICYSGKGLREILPHAPNAEQKNNAENLQKQTEDFLIEKGYILKIPLNEIFCVLF